MDLWLDSPLSRNSVFLFLPTNSFKIPQESTQDVPSNKHFSSAVRPNPNLSSLFEDNLILEAMEMVVIILVKKVGGF